MPRIRDRAAGLLDSQLDDVMPVYTTAQTRALKAGSMMDMLITIAVLITLTVAVVIHSVSGSAPVSAAKLGFMSERWLAEHRASHS